MDLLDRILLEWSYRCEKGYPDLNNEKDLDIFKNLFEVDLSKTGKKPFDYLSLEAQQEALKYAQIFKIPQKHIKASSKTRAIFLTDMPRGEFLNIAKQEGFSPGNPLRNTVRKGSFELQHKPLTAQIGGGHGKLNEQIFLTNLQQAIEESNGKINLILKGDKIYRVDNITDIQDSSRINHTQYYKADVDIISNNKVILGISIKKQGSSRWESSKIRFKKLYDTFLSKAANGELDGLRLTPREGTNKYWMQNEEGINYGKVVVEDLPETFYKEIIFGPDTEYPIIVVEKTFTNSDFTLEGDNLVVNVHNIYEKVEDVIADGKKPVLVFNHHIDKPYGIELRAFPESELPLKGGRSNTYYLPYEKLI